MPIVGVEWPTKLFDPGPPLPIITRAGVSLTDPQYIALLAKLEERGPRNRVRLVLLDEPGSPILIDEYATKGWVLEQIPSGESLAEHVNHETPHPAYDDMPSLALVYTNGLI